MSERLDRADLPVERLHRRLLHAATADSAGAGGCVRGRLLAPPSFSPTDPGIDRDRLLAEVFRLEAFTIGGMMIEARVALVAGVFAGFSS